MLLGKRISGRQVTSIGMMFMALSGGWKFLHPIRWMSEGWVDGISGFLTGAAITTLLIGIVRLRREGGRF